MAIHARDRYQRDNRNPQGGQRLSALFEGLLDQRANPNYLCACSLRQARQSQDGGAAGEEIIDDKNLLSAGKILGRDDQLDIAPFRMRRSQGEKDLVGHSDRLVFACVDNWEAEMQACCERGGNARDLSSEDFGGAAALEMFGEFATTSFHQFGVDLMIDKPIYFENTPAQIAAIALNSFFECLHVFQINMSILLWPGRLTKSIVPHVKIALLTSRMKNSLLKFILASNSPRREELLSLSGQAFDILPANVNEETREAEGGQDYVTRLAKEKAEIVGAAFAGREALILAADTTVVFGSHILAKPLDASEAKSMLTELRGKTHMVYTGITVLRAADGVELSDLASTEVPMRNYSEQEMNEYVASGNPLDKAGAYAIQHAGFHPVENMSGCYANVVGLPLCHLQRTLQKWNIEFDVDLPAACQRYLAYECPATEKILNWEL